MALVEVYPDDPKWVQTIAEKSGQSEAAVQEILKNLSRQAPHQAPEADLESKIELMLKKKGLKLPERRDLTPEERAEADARAKRIQALGGSFSWFDPNKDDPNEPLERGRDIE